MAMKLSDYVFDFLASQGVRHVFMLPGGGAMHLNDSLGARKDMAYVCNLHEQAAAIAAEASARATNNLGVALVTTGPGGTNAITGVAGAWLESTPCLILSGQVKRADMKGDCGVRQLGPQELDIVEMVRSITKYAVTITDPATIRHHMEKAVCLARRGRPGPVWIDIPLDVQGAPIEPSSLAGFDPGEAAQPRDASDLQEKAARTIAMLQQAERPVLLVGNGVRIAGGQDILRELVDRLQIPVLRTWMGADLIPDDHPMCFGKPGTIAPRGPNFILQNCDLLIAVGARLDFAVTGFDQAKCARAAKKVVVDVDGAEIKKLTLTDVLPVTADAKDFFAAIQGHATGMGPLDIAPWLSRCRGWLDRYPIVLPEYRNDREFISTYVLADVLSDELTGEDLLVPGSSGAGTERFNLAFRVKEGQRIFCTGALGAMGFGIPAALGGCLSSGRKRTISVDGDGGFQMNIQELETVRRLELPIKFFVINNQGYDSIRSSQRTHFGRLCACDRSSGLSLPDVVRVAEAYGVRGVRLQNPATMREDIRRVLQTPGPVVCDVMARPDESSQPRVASKARADGSMVSRPLEDLWPFLDRDELRENMIVPVLEE